MSCFTIKYRGGIMSFAPKDSVVMVEVGSFIAVDFKPGTTIHEACDFMKKIAQKRKRIIVTVLGNKTIMVNPEN
jgi:hypothetical protein